MTPSELKTLAGRVDGHVSSGDRPSDHGAALGRLLAKMVDAGGGAHMCATCAFREGSMPNRMAGTGLIAMHCAMGTDPDPFGCHHGMKDGEPSKLCAGFLAARQAPFAQWRERMEALLKELPASETDAIRADFDAWWPTIDPGMQMDVYQLGRAYAARANQGATDE